MIMRRIIIEDEPLRVGAKREEAGCHDDRTEGTCNPKTERHHQIEPARL